MEYDLLVDLEAVRTVFAMRPALRLQFLDFFQKLRNYRDHFSIAVTRDKSGRRLHVCGFRNHAVVYWIDFADRHVKVLKVTPGPPT
jgi:hypothetical protein